MVRLKPYLRNCDCERPGEFWQNLEFQERVSMNLMQKLEMNFN